MDHLANLLAVF